MRFFYSFVTITLCFFLTACHELEHTNLGFDSFRFLKENNPGLEADVVIPIHDTIVDLFIPTLAHDSLIATFSGNYTGVSVGGIEQISGKTANDFNHEIVYELTDGEEQMRYFFRIIGYDGIPQLFITTAGGEPVVSKEVYVDASFIIKNDSSFGEYVMQTLPGKIRGRGNSSWLYSPKKPYKIKFSEKVPIFGFPKNKSWVLLPELFDKSLLRTVYMCACSRAIGMEYTVNYRHIVVYLNHEYLGCYLLTDQIEEGKNRVVIDDDGFLIEDDGYYRDEPLWFMTDYFGKFFTFKYPDADKQEIVKDDVNYSFIKSYIESFETALLDAKESDRFMDYIDLDSFAKWYLVNELLGNWDPNRFYVLKSKNGKLKTGPIWDADWSLGATARVDGQWATPPYRPASDMVIWGSGVEKSMEYYTYLLQSSVFKDSLKKNWAVLKEHIEDIRDAIERERHILEYAQKANFDRWAVLNKTMGVGTIALGSWEAEVEYVQGFFEARFEWLDVYVNAL